MEVGALLNKVVMVIGGAGLLGQAVCKAILNSGGKVIVAELELNLAKKAKVEIVKGSVSQNNVCINSLDICDKNSINKSIQFSVEKYGRIDAVINCAYPRNKNYGRSFFDVEYQDFCENIDLHLGGYFLLSQLCAKFFIKQGYGNILNVSSIYGTSAPRFELYKEQNFTTPVEYAAIKSALNHLTKYMAKYLKGSNVRVNCVSPGGIYNGQPSLFCEAYNEQCLNKGMLNAEDITGTIIYLISDESKYVNGQNVIVDDGFTL